MYTFYRLRNKHKLSAILMFDTWLCVRDDSGRTIWGISVPSKFDRVQDETFTNHPNDGSNVGPLLQNTHTNKLVFRKNDVGKDKKPCQATATPSSVRVSTPTPHYFHMVVIISICFLIISIFSIKS